MTLREAAFSGKYGNGKERNIHVGAAVMPHYLDSSHDPYAAVLKAEFNSVVAEHHMKWRPMLVDEQEAVYDFRSSDKLVDWAIEHGMSVKGHTLCWHIIAPNFLADMSSNRLREALYRHIRTTVGHFYGRCTSWDVVNEAFSYDCSGRLMDSIFLEKLGPNYIEDCFHVAHQVDPNAKLIYNDTKVAGEGLDAGRSVKSDAMYNMLKGFKERGVPVHGVGLQGHFNAAGTGLGRIPTPHSVRRNVRRLGELGLSVNISEMDVRVAGLPDSVDADKVQGEIYGDIIGACLSESAFAGVTFWGFTDLHSWVHDFYQPDSPLPWDREYHPKPAVAAIRDALLFHKEKTMQGDDSAEHPVLEKPEHRWGQGWMLPEPVYDENAKAGQDKATDDPNWNAKNDH